jgi:uncharacterized membrane protein YgcG
MRPWHRAVVRGVCCALILLAALAPRLGLAQARSLYWRELAVEARLDADGRLHVKERQAMVFSGDWNGGERRFRLSGPQQLQLQGLTRISADGRRIPLVHSDLSGVDQYGWSDAHTLRWRSRRATDPPFEQTELTYELTYQLSNILLADGSATFQLDHDFAFTDRDGPIERFSLDLELDPAWRAEGDFEPQQAFGPLAPGEGARLTLPLKYVGAGHPSAVTATASTTLRYGASALLLGLLGLVFGALYRRESGIGRFAPLLDPKHIDRAWLAQHLFSLQPELVGATVDRHTSAAEVAALIARLHQEKKLASRVVKNEGLGRGDNLELVLLVDRSQFADYERALVDKLFFAGNETDTAAIRQHYKQKGFDPADSLRARLEAQMRALVGIRKASGWRVVPLVILVGLSLIGVAQVDREQMIGEARLVVTMSLWAVALVVCSILAWTWKDNPARPRLGFVWLLAVGSAHTLWLVTNVIGLPALPPIAALHFTLLGATVLACIAIIAPSREQAPGVALRQRLAAAKRYFASELDKPNPQLDDAWFPYLVALELAHDVEDWFKAFGAASPAGSKNFSAMSSSSGSGSSKSSSSNWTGGGGAFGGAGASATWMAAASTLSAGVSAPSKSSGGGGGGRSGGGGGGGW